MLAIVFKTVFAIGAGLCSLITFHGAKDLLSEPDVRKELFSWGALLIALLLAVLFAFAFLAVDVVLGG